jgi:hypothetical protein
MVVTHIQRKLVVEVANSPLIAINVYRDFGGVKDRKLYDCVPQSRLTVGEKSFPARVVDAVYGYGLLKNICVDPERGDYNITLTPLGTRFVEWLKVTPFFENESVVYCPI